MKAQMFATQQYRAKSDEFGELAKVSSDPGAIRQFQDLKNSFGALADNEDWLARNFDKIVCSSEEPADPTPQQDACA
jgi:hypothetical protein